MVNRWLRARYSTNSTEQRTADTNATTKRHQPIYRHHFSRQSNILLTNTTVNIPSTLQQLMAQQISAQLIAHSGTVGQQRVLDHQERRYHKTKHVARVYDFLPPDMKKKHGTTAKKPVRKNRLQALPTAVFQTKTSCATHPQGVTNRPLIIKPPGNMCVGRTLGAGQRHPYQTQSRVTNCFVSTTL